MYKGSDERWFFLAALSPKFFLQALEVLDRVDLMLLPGLDGDVSNLVLAAVREQINPELERQFATKPCGHWLDVMRKADVPIAPVCSRHEWANGELVEKNQLIVHALHPELGDVALPGIAVQLSRTPGAMRHLPHTGDLLDSRQMWTSPVSSDGLPEPLGRGASPRRRVGPGFVDLRRSAAGFHGAGSGRSKRREDRGPERRRL